MRPGSTRPSLLIRILESQSRPAYTIDRSYFARPRQPSFAERYRGTEFEAPPHIVAAGEPLISLGRSRVLLLAGVTACLAAVLLASAPA